MSDNSNSGLLTIMSLICCHLELYLIDLYHMTVNEIVA